MSNVIRAAIYARYSSHAQGEQSIEAQLAEGRRYAEQHGYTVVQEYCDRAQSGRTDQRTEFQRMLRDLPKRAFTVLILWKIDRFGRNREEIAINKARCKKYGVHPEYVAERIPDTPEGVVLGTVLEGGAGYYPLQLSQNVKRGRRASAEKCQSCGSPAPFGYRVGKDKRYELIPELAPVVRGIFDAYISGSSMAQIATDLNDRGFRTSRGTPFRVDNVRKILSNERYTGTFILADVRVEGGMPQIIPKDLWDRVQDTMLRNKKSPNHKWSRSEFLLTGKAFCACCGSVVTGTSGHSKSGAKYAYYACQNHRQRHSCDAKPVPRDDVETAVLEAIYAILEDDDLLDWIADQAYAVLAEADDAMDLTAELTRRQNEVEKGLQNLLRVIESGAFSETIMARISDLEQQKQQIATELATQEAAKALRLTRDHILYYLYKMRENAVECTREAQQRLVDTFIRRVYIGDGKITIQLNHSREGATLTKDLLSGISTEGSEGVRLLRSSVHQRQTRRTRIVIVDINQSPVVLAVIDYRA